MQVLVSFGLFFSLYLLVCRILPLGLLCDKLLCLCAIALVPLPATSVTPLRVSPICWMRESLSSTPAVVLPTLSNVVLITRQLPMRLSRLLSMLLPRLLSRRMTRLLSELLLRLLTRRIPKLLPVLLVRRSPCHPIR